MISSAIQVQVHEAMAEIRSKSLRQIQIDTARKWAGRAVAYAVESADPNLMGTDDVRASLMASATDCAHEAIEHAALTGNRRVLDEVIEAVRTCGILPWAAQ